MIIILSILADKENEDKVFTLFTRTAREKEEWFNHLLVAAKFMEDYERQNPKEGSPVDPDYETQKVKFVFCLKRGIQCWSVYDQIRIFDIRPKPKFSFQKI